VLIKLLKGKHLNGKDYGPGYAEDVVDVEEKVARKYLASGAAVLVVPQELPPVPMLSTESIADVVESRDPRPQRRGKR
jgi:hypothetical protein